MAEKQRTKQTNYSFLSPSTSLDTQNTLQGGIIEEWKKFWLEIPVWYYYVCTVHCTAPFTKNVVRKCCFLVSERSLLLSFSKPMCIHIVVTANLLSSMFWKWFSCKSWQDKLIGTIRTIFNQLGQSALNAKIQAFLLF